MRGFNSNLFVVTPNLYHSLSHSTCCSNQITDITERAENDSYFTKYISKSENLVWDHGRGNWVCSCISTPYKCAKNWSKIGVKGKHIHHIFKKTHKLENTIIANRSSEVHTAIIPNFYDPIKRNGLPCRPDSFFTPRNILALHGYGSEAGNSFETRVALLLSFEVLHVYFLSKHNRGSTVSITSKNECVFEFFKENFALSTEKFQYDPSTENWTICITNTLPQCNWLTAGTAEKYLIQRCFV